MTNTPSPTPAVETLSEEQLIALERVGWPTEIQRLIKAYTALRDQLARLEHERNGLRGQIVGLNTKLAQAETERDNLRADLELGGEP